jgi:hypothetical protein
MACSPARVREVASTRLRIISGALSRGTIANGQSVSRPATNSSGTTSLLHEPLQPLLKFLSDFACAVRSLPTYRSWHSLRSGVLTFVREPRKAVTVSYHSIAVLEFRPDQRIHHKRAYHTSSDNIGVGRPGCPGGSALAGCGEALSAGSGHCSRR